MPPATRPELTGCGVLGAHLVAIELQGLGVLFDAQIDDVLQDDLVRNEISR